MLRFSERNDVFRMSVRDIVDEHGGTIADYNGAGVQIILPADAGRRAILLDTLCDLGGAVVTGSRYWFPACNGEPVDQLRWKNESDRGNRSAAYVEFVTIDF